MPWNKPGQDNDRKPPQNPWGNNGRKNPSPPDLDKIFIEFFKKIRAILMGKSTSTTSSPSQQPHYSLGIGIAFAVAIGLWFLSGFFIVNPAEEAVILRFGKYTQTLQPGLHWIARFIESKYIIDAQKVYSFSLEGDFLTKSSDQDDQIKNAATLNVKDIASDQSKNLVNVELNVMYRISDPRAYLFNLMNPNDTIKQVASSALSEVVGTMKLDDVLTTGRELLASGVLTRIRQTLSNYNVGLEVTTVTLKRAQAPDNEKVRDAFNDVNRAEQDRKTSINKAEAYASGIIPLAQGTAARILADANGYKQFIVLKAQGDVARYQALQHVYATAPEVTSERMYLETIQSILQKTSKVLVDTNAGNMMYLPLDRLPSFARAKLQTESAVTGDQK
ncbi:MAG: FtsH protease activity modulator HflK [Gammaproteobacteria bacterium]|nr:FtsH protease activity modulator HflK [Gammaproteobacteria bacterium]